MNYDKITPFLFDDLMIMKEHAHFLFFNSTIPAKMTGIESAALKRYKLFEEQLNILPIYIGFNYDLNAEKTIKEFKQQGKISSQFQYVNLYQFYQNSVNSSVSHQPLKHSEKSIIHKINNKKAIVQNYDIETGIISWVNYFDSYERRVRLDNYDTRGYLSRSVFFDPNNNKRTMEQFYRIDGTICFCKYYEFENEKLILSRIWLYDKNGQPDIFFENEEKFLAKLTEFYLNSFSTNDQVTILLDRKPIVFNYVGKVNPNLNYCYLVHSFHLNKASDMNSTVRQNNFYLEELATKEAVIVLTPQQKRDIEERFGNFGNVYCIPHAVNHFPNQVDYATRQPYKVVAAGRFAAEKNHARMIRIFAKVVEEIPQATLEIFGQGALENELNHLIRELKLEHNVFLRNYTQDIYAEFSSAQCSLLTSIYEGQSLVILESLSSGCPVISLDTRYGPESMIEHNKNGFIVKRTEKELETTFANYIIQILSDTELANQLSKSAYQTALLFSEENIAPRWQHLIKEISMKNNIWHQFILKNKNQLFQHIKQTQTEHLFNGYWLVSASDGIDRAKTETIRGGSVSNSAIALLKQLEGSSIEMLCNLLNEIQTKFSQPLKWIKIEWITEAQSTSWLKLKEGLKNYKRNYFRSGIAFPNGKLKENEPWLFATETELNAFACLYAGADISVAQVNQNNLENYLKARFGSKSMPTFADDMPVYTFKTAGIFFDIEKQEVCKLSTLPRTQGRRELGDLTPDFLTKLIEKVTAYLGNQVLTDENGKYQYGHFPCFGRTINTYNTLRHASSTYALLEGYEFCQTHQTAEIDLIQLRIQIELALDYLTTKIIREYPDNLAYAVEINDEIKLGANAVSILALTKYISIFTDSSRNSQYLDIAEKLANGIVRMQQENGSFVHILDAKTLNVIDESRVIYYDGEAAFGLMRLYGLTKDERWINCVIKAFDYFIQAGHNGAHDHWLSYCSNELAIYRPERKYFEFAVNNVKGYVNFIRNRITTFPTLLELSMAFHKMLLKLDEFPQYADVLAEFDVPDFYSALHSRANYLLNGVFFPELAMHYKKPNTILYGCFIRHHTFRVRIDDVEHYLSGWIAYHQMLVENRYPKSCSK